MQIRRTMRPLLLRFIIKTNDDDDDDGSSSTKSFLQAACHMRKPFFIFISRRGRNINYHIGECSAHFRVLVSAGCYLFEKLLRVGLIKNQQDEMRT